MFSKKNKSESNPKENGGIEKRAHERFLRNYVLTYHEKNNPEKQYSVTQLKNLSIGGLCFITDQHFEKNVELSLALQTPYVSETTYLSGIVLESHEKVTDMLYETRIEFTKLTPESKFLLNKLIEFFKNGE
jgi:hypothetical protein